MRKNKSFGQPRRAGSNSRVISLIVILVLIVGVFFLLERLTGSVEKQRYEVSPPVVKQQMPDRPVPDRVQNVYSATQAPTVRRAQKTDRSVKHGSIAIIIDDMGAKLQDTDLLLAINLPITFAVIPGLAHSRSVAEAVNARGRVVMIHMPMEPKGYPGQRLEKNGLLISQSSEEISERVKGYLREIPHASGANNHMGSAFTEREDKMMPVLEVMKHRGMFFVDSRTSGASVGYSLAVSMGVQAGTRSIFLDNEQSVDKIKEQLLEAAKMASRRGNVIAIGHPHPGTIQALQEMMPKLQREGITFVSATQLVK